MDLIDISRPLSPATAVWPGDQPVEWTWTARKEEGSSVNLGALRLSTHAGTHADAPRHATEEGSTTSAFDPSVFVGPAVVIDVRGADTICPQHVQDVSCRRVLFKTSASDLATDQWPEAVTPIRPDTVEKLHEKKVALVGTDAPSVDALDSEELPAHHALIQAEIVNIEGLTLAEVQPGIYGLLALPMKLEGADAAPVRAVLGKRSLFTKASSDDGK
jgi:arylformamidase